MIEGKLRCVVVANGVYVTLPKLDRAVPDAEDLEKTLEFHASLSDGGSPKFRARRAARLDRQASR